MRLPARGARSSAGARMTLEHIIFIPGVLLVGLATGYVMGARAARAEAARRRAKMRE